MTGWPGGVRSAPIKAQVTRLSISRKMSSDKSYSSTLLLPKTSFPLRTGGAKHDEQFRAKSCAQLYEWQVCLALFNLSRLSNIPLDGKSEWSEVCFARWSSIRKWKSTYG